MADVCFVTKVWWGGGAAWVAQNIAQATAEAGCRVTYIAPLSEPLSDEPVHANLTRVVVAREALRGAGSRASRSFATAMRIATTLWAILRERLRTRTFVFSIPDPLIVTLPVFAFLRLSGASVIFLVHDAVPHAWRLPPFLRGLECGADGFSYRLASMLVVMTTALKKALVEEFRLAPGKIHVIPHGPFRLGAVTPLPGAGKFLQFGQIRSNKNVLEVIRGISRARSADKGIVLVIAGRPYPLELAYWAECQAEIAKDPEGFDLRIRFVEDDEVGALVAETDAFMLAYENFDSQSGVGVLAGSCGRPVIGTGSGGLAELFANGMCGELLPTPVTPQGVADAVAAFRARPIAQWREEAARGAEILRDAMSWARIGRAYCNLVTRNQTILSPGHQVS